MPTLWARSLNYLKMKMETTRNRPEMAKEKCPVCKSGLNVHHCRNAVGMEYSICYACGFDTRETCDLCGKRSAQTKEGYCLICQTVIDYDPADILDYWPEGNCVE